MSYFSMTKLNNSSICIKQTRNKASIEHFIINAEFVPLGVVVRTSSFNIAGIVSVQNFILSSNNLQLGCGCSVRFIYAWLFASNSGHCGICSSSFFSSSTFGFLKEER